ncbi:T9SS type B sorting domain-containing protein [Cytophaga sp. FL35]|uniref:T9SS type B sorting domain-containing protein n=1 Tax=Cytophaga sp. FL35 TaxID=1904456 RepID=UPI0016534E0D|nr:T9SS type B sorting domain-containing protein [Cytophaga sp. FL35]MBC6998189.1 T9SS type B sorting domain-containing protein [Cytophaga sp. FL35]
MNLIQKTLLILFAIGVETIVAQVSPDCINAIPVCNNTPVNGGTNGYGVDDFSGTMESGCLERTLTGSIESNSAWYRFRTGASGQLGFNISIDVSEDWDFSLYQTNDCNNLGEPVRCNFFDNSDSNTFIGVGEDPTGDDLNVQYEEWLQVEPGQDYYLFINNFSNNNAGFSIQFSGHIFVTNPYDALDCSIIDSLLGPPITECDGNTVQLDATTANASTYNWFQDIGNGYEQLVGEHNPILQVSNSAMYRVEVVRPTGNLYSNVQVAFYPMPVANPLTNSASCSGLQVFDLEQKDLEILGGQNSNDFLISYHLSMDDALNGVNSQSKQLTTSPGTQTIYARISSKANPRCFDASQSFDLINMETPQINFPTEAYLCGFDTGAQIGEASPNPNYRYQWSTGQTSPSIMVQQEGEYRVTVTNEQAGLLCEVTATIMVVRSNPPEIQDLLIEDLSTNNTITVMTASNRELEYQLDDGPYQEGHTFYQVLPGRHTITVNDPMGCGSVSEEVIVVGFPKFFSPNADGSNDYWHIEGIETLENPIVHIFDRYGKLLAELNETSPGWDGVLNGKPLPETDYWFQLTYSNLEGERMTAKYVNNHFSLKR